MDDDPRVTRVGRLIRKSSLDEGLQLANVLAGDLSVMGPRPVTLAETYEFGGDRGGFLSVRPSITGWWQVMERNEATWENGRRQALELRRFEDVSRCCFRARGSNDGKRWRQVLYSDRKPGKPTRCVFLIQEHV